MVHHSDGIDDSRMVTTPGRLTQVTPRVLRARVKGPSVAHHPPLRASPSLQGHLEPEHTAPHRNAARKPGETWRRVDPWDPRGRLQDPAVLAGCG